MPKPATGTPYKVGDDEWATRISVTPTLRPSFRLPHCQTDAAAAERSKLLGQFALRLRRVQLGAESKISWLKDVAEATPEQLPTRQQALEAFIGGKVAPLAAPSTVPTFGEVFRMWFSGELNARHPDHVKIKRSSDDDLSRYTNWIGPVLDDIPADKFEGETGLNYCVRVMDGLPRGMAPATRRNVGGVMTRQLKIMAWPMRLIKASPIPAGFLPKAPKPKALASIYPDEDRRLLACVAVPLEYRILWGFLCREGMREGEALALTWGDLDLVRGAVRLDKNKSDDPRVWSLHSGVATALRAYRALTVHGTAPSDRVFVNPLGRQIVDSGALGLPALLRSHLRLIGLHEERPELFASTDERRQMRVHDLRGTFVTVSLANGRSESWISDRTGHKSSVMIRRYKRAARTFAELQTGELTPLNEALIELASWHPTGMATSTISEMPLDVAMLAGRPQRDLKARHASRKVTESLETCRNRTTRVGYRRPSSSPMANRWPIMALWKLRLPMRS